MCLNLSFLLVTSIYCIFDTFFPRIFLPNKVIHWDVGTLTAYTCVYAVGRLWFCLIVSFYIKIWKYYYENSLSLQNFTFSWTTIIYALHGWSIIRQCYQLYTVINSTRFDGTVSALHVLTLPDVTWLSGCDCSFLQSK